MELELTSPTQMFSVSFSMRIFRMGFSSPFFTIFGLSEMKQHTLRQAAVVPRNAH